MQTITRHQKYLTLARSVAQTFSKDPSTQVGAVIVRPDNTVASIGYNGFPRGMNDDPSLYENREYKHRHIVHAEANAIIHSRENLENHILYVWPILPCPECMKLIINSGIKTVVTVKDDTYSQKTKDWQCAVSLEMAAFADVEVYSVSL